MTLMYGIGLQDYMLKTLHLIPFHWHGDDGALGTIRFGDPDGFFLTFDEFFTEIESKSYRTIWGS